MQVRYRISLEDFREAQALMRKLRRHYRVFRALLFVCLAPPSLFVLTAPLLIWMNRQNPDKAHATWAAVEPVLIVLGFVAVYWALLHPLRIKRAYARNPALHREITAEINETRFTADDGAGNRTEQMWNTYDRFGEGKRIFLIGTPGNIFSIVSKSEMRESEIQELRALLAGAVPKR
jgi:hypothetical protein